MNDKPLTPLQHARNWIECLIALVLFCALSGYLDKQHSETDALRLSAQVSKDRAAEFAAINSPARVAAKE